MISYTTVLLDTESELRLSVNKNYGMDTYTYISTEIDFSRLKKALDHKYGIPTSQNEDTSSFNWIMDDVAIRLLIMSNSKIVLHYSYIFPAEEA